jgi:MFS family permease
MSKESRGYGTTVVASVGITGAVVAALVADRFDWRIAYIVGGVMGFALLLLRLGVYESGMFEQVRQDTATRRGAFSMLFATRERAVKYVSVILVGVPIWYVIGVLITFSPELGAAMGMSPAPNAGRAVMFCYIGLAVGDLASGALSQVLGSRKRVALIFLSMTAVTVGIYFTAIAQSLPAFYTLCTAIGFGIGYWAIFVTIASEQFGTNIRATATTTVPNFVRGAVVPLTLTFQALKAPLGIVASGALVGVVALSIAFLALRGLEETFGKDLDYVEP